MCMYTPPHTHREAHTYMQAYIKIRKLSSISKNHKRRDSIRLPKTTDSTQSLVLGHSFYSYKTMSSFVEYGSLRKQVWFPRQGVGWISSGFLPGGSYQKLSARPQTISSLQLLTVTIWGDFPLRAQKGNLFLEALVSDWGISH